MKYIFHPSRVHNIVSVFPIQPFLFLFFIPSRIRRQDSNPRPLGCNSSPLTTRPWRLVYLCEHNNGNVFWLQKVSLFTFGWGQHVREEHLSGRLVEQNQSGEKKGRELSGDNFFWQRKQFLRQIGEEGFPLGVRFQRKIWNGNLFINFPFCFLHS